MNEKIKQLKQELLEKLKQQKQSIVDKTDALVQQRFTQKNVQVNESCVKLDNAYAQYKQEKFAAYNAEITRKAEEVNAKKTALVQQAKEEAKNEVEAEISLKTAEYDSEIARLQKELA